MNAVQTITRNSPVLQTTMNAVILRKIIDFCYTDEVCLEGTLQTFSLLKYATDYGITDLVDKCRTYLKSTIVATPSTPKPLPTPQKLIIFGGLGDTTCFSAAMLVSMDAQWMELPEISGSQKFARRLTSVAYCGDDCVVVSGGLGEVKSKQVSRRSDWRNWFAFFGQCVNSIIHSKFIWSIWNRGASQRCQQWKLHDVNTLR